jgi:hypothetical protein
MNWRKSVGVEKMRNILLAFVLIIALMGLVAATGTPGVEMKPGEAAFERLFDKGIGQPWVGGNPPWQQGEYGQYAQYQSPLVLPIQKNIARGLHYNLLGTVYANGNLAIGSGQGAIWTPYPSGWYNVYGCYDINERLIGVYIDLGGYYSPGY